MSARAEHRIEDPVVLADQLDSIGYKLEQRAGLHVNAPLLPERAEEWAAIVRRAQAYVIASCPQRTRFLKPRGLRGGRN